MDNGAQIALNKRIKKIVLELNCPSSFFVFKNTKALKQ